MTENDPNQAGSKQPEGSNGTSEGWISPVPNTGSQSYGYGSYTAGEERAFKDYPLILLRHWPVIVAMVLIGATIAMYQTSKTPRLYRASAMVNIGSYVPPLEGPISASLEEEVNARNYRNTQIRLLRSFTLAEQVLLEHPDIHKYLNPSFQIPTKQEEKLKSIPVHLLQRYLGMISFNVLDDTDLVMIYSTGTSPVMASRMANAHSASFINLVMNRRKREAQKNLSFLETKYDEITGRVEADERKRLKHAEQYLMGASSSDLVETTFAQQYSNLVQSLNEAIAVRAGLQADYRTLRKTKGMSGLDSNEAVQSYIINLAQQERQYEQLKKRLRNSRHPFLISLKDSIEATRDTLSRVAKGRVKEARNRYLVAAEQERFLRNEFDRLSDEQVEMSKHRVEQDTLNQNILSLKEVQASLSKRLEDAMVNIQSNQESVTLVDRAFPPASHFSPNERSNFLTGCMLGGLLGVILAFLLDFVDNRVRSITDLQSSIRAPILGVVPGFSKDVLRLSRSSSRMRQPNKSSTVTKIIESNENLGDLSDVQQAGAEGVPTIVLGKDSPILPVSAPFSAESEAFRGILATLTVSGAVEGPRKLLITSGQQGDGKTTLAVNLAASLAQMGERTLLIDADLRLPNVQSYFGLPREVAGLADYLTGNAEPVDLIVNGGLDDLFLMPAGRVTPNPAALLRSDKMKKFLDDMQAKYDFVLIDSPPIGPVADSLLLSQHVDGVALVVRSGETSKAVAESAISRLRQVGATIVGLILNDTASGGSYWRGGYRYRTSDYHNYHSV